MSISNSTARQVATTCYLNLWHATWYIIHQTKPAKLSTASCAPDLHVQNLAERFLTVEIEIELTLERPRLNFSLTMC